MLRTSPGSMTLLLALSTCCAAPVSSAFAADNAYPVKPVQLVVPFPPGGVTDALARVLAQALSGPLGQSVVVLNKPGASGMIAAESVKVAPPDGYTLLMGHIGTHAVNPALYPKITYRPIDDFTPISLVASTPVMLLVSSKVPAKSISELIALAKQKPGRLNYASFGAGSSSHLYAELFKNAAELDITHVPYKGPSPAMQDLIGGQVDMMFDTVASSLPQIKAGNVRALAVASAERVPLARDVPTFKELGMGQLDGGPWFGLFAPRATPPDVIARLETEVRKALANEQVAQALQVQGIRIVGSTGGELATFQNEEMRRWAALIKKFDIHVD